MRAHVAFHVLRAKSLAQFLPFISLAYKKNENIEHFNALPRGTGSPSNIHTGHDDRGGPYAILHI